MLKRILIPFPLFIARISAKLFQLLPTPLLTEDQLRLLKYDNILSGKYKNNSDIGSPSKATRKLKNMPICGKADNTLQKNTNLKKAIKINFMLTEFFSINSGTSLSFESSFLPFDYA